MPDGPKNIKEQGGAGGTTTGVVTGHEDVHPDPPKYVLNFLFQLCLPSKTRQQMFLDK